MFTWICPQCGKEVPPAYTDCPNCAERAAQAAQTAPPAADPAAAPAVPAAPAPPPPAPYAYVPPRRAAVPTWLLTLLVAGGTTAVIGGAIWLLSNHAETKPSAAVESPAAKPGLATNPVQRNIEVSGVRFDSDAKHKSKTIVKFVVTNHSGMDLTGLAGNVTLWGSTRRSEEDAQGTFTIATNLHPYESKELEAPLTTKLKIYELPDWQNVTLDIQITAPSVK